MEKLSRYLSFFSLVAASLLLVGLYLSYRQVEKTGDELAGSLTIAVFLDSFAGSEEIEESSKYIEDLDNIYIKDFLSSREIYEEMAENSAISEHIEVIGEDFIFPPTYEIGVREIAPEKLERSVSRLREFENIDYVDYNKDAALRAHNIFYKVKTIYRIVSAGAGFLAVFLFFLSGYFKYFDEKQEYLFLKLYRTNLKGRLNAGIINRIFTGFFAAAIAGGAVYLVPDHILSMEFFSVKELAVLFAAPAVIAAGVYAVIIHTAILNKDK